MLKAIGLMLGAMALSLMALGALPATAAPAPAPWLASWAASPQAPTLVAGPRQPLSARFDNQTLRQVVRISASGSKVRVRFSNEFGTAPLRIGAAHVAVAADNGAIQPGTDRVLTFGGAPTAVIPPGAPLLSDPVELKVPALSSLSVSLYLPGDTGPCTCHPVGVQTGLVSDVGDFTSAASFPTKSSFLFRAFLTGVEVLPDRPGKVVVVLDDSVSDGTASTPDRNQRWPDRLAERLAARSGQSWGVANAGLNGNRLLADGVGPSAQARFDRDVLATPGAAYVVVLIGLNDLGIALGGTEPANPALKPADMIAGYRQLIARAHAAGLKIYGATITPYEGVGYWSPQGDAARQAINQWIRTGGEYDGVIDFDLVWRDPAKPSQIKAPFGAPDRLHGSDQGYRAMGDAVDLRLFR